MIVETLKPGFCDVFSKQTQEHFNTCPHCRHMLKSLFHSLPPMIKMMINKDTRETIERMVVDVPTGDNITPETIPTGTTIEKG